MGGVGFRIVVGESVDPSGEIALDIILHHQEKLNGRGYPDRLKAEDISQFVRIVTIADIFDALTAVRPYKQAWTLEAAVSELERLVQAGKLDADCVGAVQRHLPEVEAIRERFRDD